MGQYYYPVNLTKGEYLVAHDYGNGIKLMEHSYIENNFMNVIERLLAPDGLWYKSKIVWAGDYADDGKFIPERTVLMTDEGEVIEDFNLYTYASYSFKQIRPEAAPEESTWQEKHDLHQPKTESLRYVCNWTQRTYVDLKKVDGDENDYRIHPLSLLTSDGNGRGGGDFRGTNPFVGKWAGDSISMESTVPTNFIEIKPDFKE